MSLENSRSNVIKFVVSEYKLTLVETGSEQGTGAPVKEILLVLFYKR